MKYNDAELIQRVLSGDDAAFSVLVKKYQKQVHALAWRKIGDFHIAEEITQDTFLKAYMQLATLKEPQSFAGWLYVIAANRCTSWLRKKRISTQSLEELDQTDTEQLEKEAYSEFVVEENERVSGHAQRDAVKKLLAKLGESERTVMTLHYFGEMSCTEIGTFMGVSANTVKSRLRRAQQRLQKEEPMIREALDHFQISPNFTENIMQEISRIKPTAPSGSKPFVPWVVAASTLAVVLLMLGFGNSKYLIRFQKPYSFDATAETTVEIVDTSIVSNLQSKPDVRMQIKNTNTLARLNQPEDQQNENFVTLSEDTQTEETMKDYTQWELPKKAKARLGKGSVNGIKFTPDGTHLAVETAIGVWLYDANTGEETTLFPDVEHDNPNIDRTYINMLVSSIDRNTITCEGLDEDKDLWSLEKDRLNSILPDLRGRNNVLQFRAESIELANAGWRMNLPWHATTGLWNLDDGTNESNKARLVKTQMGMQLAISTDKMFLAAARERGYWSKKYKMPAIQVWNRTTGKCVFTVEESDHDIETLVFSPDSKTLAYAESSNIVKLWDIESGSLQNTIKAADPFQTLAFSPDGSLLASGSTDGIVRFWKVGKSEKKSISDRIRNIAGKPVPYKLLKGHAENTKFTAIDFSPDGKKVVSANSDGTIRLWDTDSGKQQLTLTQHSDLQTALAFNAINQPNLHDATNRTLTSLGASNSHLFVSVWDIETGSRSSIDKVDKGKHIGYEVAVSPDGSLFVTNEKIVRLWETQTKSVLSTIGGEEYAGFGAKVVFSPDGKLLAVTARKDNTIQIWDVPNRKTLCRLKGHTTYVYSLAFSPDNKTVVTSGWTGKDVTIRLWDTMTGEMLTSFPDQGAVAFAPDSNTFVGGTHIYAWNPETIQYDRTVRLEDVSKSNPPTAITFSPDGSILLSGNRDGIIQLRNSTTGKIISELTGHASWISQLVFSEDGTTLATSGADGTILLWNWDRVLNESENKE